MTATLPFTVTPGGQASVLTVAKAGLFVKNLDTVNSVWLSESQAVQPGYGFKLGPLASFQVQDDSPLYAIVDTGVNSNVILTLSSTVENASDPVAVATATAAALLAQGIPTVYTVKQLAQPTAQAVGASVVVNPAGYSTLYVQLNPGVNSGACVLQATDSLGLSEFFVAQGGPSLSTPPSATWALPTHGIPITFTVIAATGTTPSFGYTVTGTNKVYEEFKLLGYKGLPRKLSVTIALGAGGTAGLNQADNYYATPFTARGAYTFFDGPVSVDVRLPGGALTSFEIGYTYKDASGSAQNVAVYVGTAEAFDISVNMPATPVNWYVITTAAQTVNVLITIAPDKKVT